MPVEVGEVFFFCLGHDQAKTAEESMAQMARQKQAELLESLHPKPR